MKTVNLNGKEYGFMQPERRLEQQMSKAATITIGKDIWQKICKASEATEEQAAGIVQQALNGGYENYNSCIDMSGFNAYDTALKALHSLIRSLGLEPETTIILEKQ